MVLLVAKLLRQNAPEYLSIAARALSGVNRQTAHKEITFTPRYPRNDFLSATSATDLPFISWENREWKEPSRRTSSLRENQSKSPITD
jgi:hypothetical protein